MSCGTKVIAKGNVQALKNKWRGGWHRVVVLGNHKQEFMELARLMGLRAIDEGSL